MTGIRLAASQVKGHHRILVILPSGDDRLVRPDLQASPETAALRDTKSPGNHQNLAMNAHLPARDHRPMDLAPALYAIRIKGQLGPSALTAFPALVPRRHGTDTVLTGLLDRSALFGVLAEVESLGLDLLEVRQLTHHRRSPESGDTAEGQSLW